MHPEVFVAGCEKLTDCALELGLDLLGFVAY